MPTAEHQRLSDSESREADWKNWGPYVSDRAWGTVREDYSGDGNAWDYFPHDHARSRAYRWNEDGLAGFCNRFQNVCLAWAFWNEKDAILKERFYGLTNEEGNHGEDVKEYYFHLDGTPTHSYMKMLYKYPQVAYPYQDLWAENGQRDQFQPEYELFDAVEQSFRDNRYFDIFIEYAKLGQEDILCKVTAINRGPDPAPLHILPHCWFRNTWSWGSPKQPPHLKKIGPGAVQLQDRHMGARYWYTTSSTGEGQTLVTHNDTNSERLFGVPNRKAYVKDAFHQTVVKGKANAVSPHGLGTKSAGHFQQVIKPGESFEVWTRFCQEPQADPFSNFTKTVETRKKEADDFYLAIQQPGLSQDERMVQRQAFAGLLWTKQFYHYSVELWLKGDPTGPQPPNHRAEGRNEDWIHLYNNDVISMPDKWEYPWYAAWDLGFHTLPIAMVDPEWAKRQLILMLREWYMHPNGQIPAYEWNFSAVNPPVHAWACWRVYKIDRNFTGKPDIEFLERVFQKLMLNFTWWVNRKDIQGNNIFEGGFLGLDNIGVFDRSEELPGGGHIEQADGTAWMGMFCLNMLAIALELARYRPAYEDVATKFFEHFVYISYAINHLGGSGLSLWDDIDGFFYDVLYPGHGTPSRLRVRSLVGLITLFAVETFDPKMAEKLPRFKRRMEWFVKYRPNLVQHVASLTEPGQHDRRLISIVDRTKLARILQRVLDKNQFLSEYGIRSLSKEHQRKPFQCDLAGTRHAVSYDPAESTSRMFGGNSNWRGPIWFPLNYLLVESLQKYHHYYGNEFQVELPTGSGKKANLNQVAHELSRRLCHIFLRDEQSQRRAVLGNNDYFQSDPHWRDCVPFYEYFHGDTGEGLGASHQTGWTALVAKLLQQCSKEEAHDLEPAMTSLFHG